MVGWASAVMQFTATFEMAGFQQSSVLLDLGSYLTSENNQIGRGHVLVLMSCGPVITTEVIIAMVLTKKVVTEALIQRYLLCDIFRQLSVKAFYTLALMELLTSEFCQPVI